MNRQQLIREDFHVKLQEIVSLYHRKDYCDALSKVNTLLTFETIKSSQFKQLRLNTLSLRGLFNYSLLRYSHAYTDFEECLQMEPQHVPTLMRRIKLYLKQTRLEECIKDVKRLLSIVPQYQKMSYQLQQLQEAIQQVKGDKKFELKKQYNQIFCEDDEQEENMCKFSGIKNIQKAKNKTEKSNKSASKKGVDFGEDKFHEFNKQKEELQVVPLPKIDPEAIKQLDQYLKQALDQDTAIIETPSTFKMSNMKNPQSILKASTFGFCSKIRDTTEVTQSFSVFKVKDIDGKSISKRGQAKMGASLFVNEKQAKKNYNPGQQPTKSMMKLNGSFSVDKFKSVIAEKNISLDQDGKSGFGRIKDIDGKSKKSSKIAYNVISQEDTQDQTPKFEFKLQVVGNRSSFKQPGRSILKPPKGMEGGSVMKRSIVCFKD